MSARSSARPLPPGSDQAIHSSGVVTAARACRSPASGGTAGAASVGMGGRAMGRGCAGSPYSSGGTAPRTKPSTADRSMSPTTTIVMLSGR